MANPKKPDTFVPVWTEADLRIEIVKRLMNWYPISGYQWKWFRESGKAPKDSIVAEALLVTVSAEEYKYWLPILFEG